MSVRDIVMLVGLWVMTLGAIFVLPSTWRGTNQDTIRMGFSWWPMGKPSLHGGIRTIPVDFFAMSCGALGASSHFAAQAAERAWETGLRLVAYKFFGLFALSLMLGFSIFMFNWPKRLVAPHLRDEKGFVGMWGDEIRERREQQQRNRQ